MKIKDLINELARYPESMEVRIKDHQSQLFLNIDGVTKYKSIDCVYIFPESIEN